MTLIALIHYSAALILAPLLLGIINRTKAFFAGRTGQPLLQPYYDLAKLMNKGAVYSRTTSWVFRANPIIGLSAILIALLLVPMSDASTVVSGRGDLFLLAYLLGLARFFIVVAALDTGSSFEGMGASREVQFSALVEPALLLGLSTMALATHSFSLTKIYSTITFQSWAGIGPALVLVSTAFLIVLLAENARIPVDDPNTHLELTMIHEVMVLDYSGPDLAMILYGAALKLWLYSAILIGIVLPIHSGSLWLNGIITLLGLLGLAVIIGVIESSMARLRLLRIPHLLVGAGVLSALALLLVLR